MNSDQIVAPDEIERLYRRLNNEAEKFGYHLNPDEFFTKELVSGLLVNEKRYGYMACPCRLASGRRPDDLDLICPCDYRDPDLTEFDACYCGLYISERVLRGERLLSPIPERRPAEEARVPGNSFSQPSAGTNLRLPVWRCKVCGYLCAREEPPEVCPICKVKKERFERFM
jgi:ferredoxin-thioredoxin reductase catalytic subunit/rubredoxin